MLKSMILFTCFVAIAVAAPVADRDEEHEVISILKSEVNKGEDGSYHLNYESSDGTVREEDAVLTNAGTKDEALEVRGSYKYIDENGEEVEVFYTAGVNGFVPYGKTINEEISAVAEAAKNLPQEDEDEEEYVKGGKKLKSQ